MLFFATKWGDDAKICRIYPSFWERKHYNKGNYILTPSVYKANKPII